MELKGSRTESVLRRTFVDELITVAEYRYYGEVARKSGLDQIADVFEATASNEAEHARHEFEFLGDYKDKDIVENLERAIEQEHRNATQLYVEAAKVADSEGFTDLAGFFTRQCEIEAKHEKMFAEMLRELQSGAEFNRRTVGHSRLTMAQIMLPDQANPAGFVHGGELMKLMDNAAGAVAARHCHANVVTASIEDIQFKTPVRIGSLAILRGKLVFASQTSMWVRVDVEAERLSTGERTLALSANFVMVAMGPDSKPMAVPPLMVATEKEAQDYQAAKERYELVKNR
jgi:acyl-CoA hydrolase/ferritin